MLHYVMPAAFLLDWLWFTPRGRLQWIDPVKALGFPLIFGVWTLVHGLMTHWWPYGFVNVDELGLDRVLAVFAACWSVSCWSGWRWSGWIGPSVERGVTVRPRRFRRRHGLQIPA